VTRYGVLGTGTVGQTLASKLVSLGHEVRMGAREAGNKRAVDWATEAGELATEGSFAEAAAFGAVVINATAGVASVEALTAAGPANLAGKVVIDVANPLDFSHGFPPKLAVANDDSLGEQIQRAFPTARVVKALNTMTADVMVDPGRVPGAHTVFVSGDDPAAREEVAALLEEFGWPRASILDLGPISSARGTEMYLALWLRIMTTAETPYFNINVVRAG
jgi:8-hydroxy-5-deazaflavin:NADPH oxidoreductase